MQKQFELRVTISLGAPVLSLEPRAASDGAHADVKHRLSAESPAEGGQSLFPIASLVRREFSWQTALCMVLASKLSYDTSSAVRNTVTVDWGLETCEFIDADDTQCFVAASADAALVAFRGTESMRDWLGNLNVASTTRPYGAVHRGFLAAFQVVEARLRSVLGQLSGRPVLLTGHSLGGALATVAAVELQGSIPISGIYTFGQPAVAKANMVPFLERHYSDSFYRIVNNDDIVARVPPTYRHAGRLIRFDDDGGFANESSADIPSEASVDSSDGSQVGTSMLDEVEFDRLRAALLMERAQVGASGQESLGAMALEGTWPGVSDHRIDNYLSKVERQARNS